MSVERTVRFPPSRRPLALPGRIVVLRQRSRVWSSPDHFAQHWRFSGKGKPPETAPADGVPPVADIGCVDRGKSGARGDGEMQRRGVARADQQFRIGTNQLPVDQRQQTAAAPPAADDEDGANRGVGEHVVDVGRAIPVGPRQVAEAVGDMLPEPGHQPHAPDRVLGCFEVQRIVVRTRRRDQADRIAKPEPRRLRHRPGRCRRRQRRCREQPAHAADDFAPAEHPGSIVGHVHPLRLFQQHGGKFIRRAEERQMPGFKLAPP